MKIQKFDTGFYVLGITILLLMMLCYAFRLYEVHSYLLMAITIHTIVFFILTLFSKRINTFMVFLILLIIILAGYSIPGILSSEINYLSSFIGLMISIFYMYITLKTKISNQAFIFIQKLYYLLFLVLSIGTFSSINYTQNGYLKFGFENQNTLSSYLLIMIINFKIIVSLLPFKKNSFLNYLVYFIGVYMIYLTGSRSAFLSSILFFIIILTKENFWKIRILPIIALITPLIIPILYVILWELYGDSNLILLGRTIFTEREIIWGSMDYSITELFYSHYSNIDNFMFKGQGSHNTYLSLIWGYGLLTFALLIVYISLVFNEHFKKFKTEKNVKIIYGISVGIVIIFFHGSFEDVLFRNIWYSIMSINILMYFRNNNIVNGGKKNELHS